MSGAKINTRLVFIFLMLFSVSLIIYFPSIKGDFLLDDKALIVDNEYIKHIRFIPLLFTSHLYKFSFPVYEEGYNYYRPVPGLLSAIVYRFSGLNPLGYHLFSVMTHSLNALLVFYLIYKLFANPSLAFLSSILFCVHPIHVESVSFISSLAELLVTLFILLSAVSYIKYAETKRGVMYLISLFSFILAFLSKEAGFLIFVPLFVLFTGLKAKLPKISVLANFFSFLSILAVYITLRLTILVPMQSMAGSRSSFWADALNFLGILAEYIRLLIFPDKLHIFRTIKPVSFLRPDSFIIPVVLPVFFTLVAVICMKKKRYVLLFGAGWFILGLAHLIKFMHKFGGHITMEEHWLYFSSIGFFVALSSLILNIRRTRFILVMGSVLVLFYGSLTFINSSHWRDEKAFYNYNLGFLEPSLSVIPRTNLAVSLYKRKLYKEAADQVNYILSVEPNNLFAYLQLGDIFMAMKKYPEAKEAYKNALKIDYFYWQALRRLKLAFEEAGEEFKDDINPRLSPAEARIVSYIRMGEFDKALKALNKELSVSPTAGFYTLLGIARGKMGQYNLAIEAFNDSLKINPDYSLALYNLAVIYENRNDIKNLAKTRKRLAEIEGAK